MGCPVEALDRDPLERVNTEVICTANADRIPYVQSHNFPAARFKKITTRHNYILRCDSSLCVESKQPPPIITCTN